MKILLIDDHVLFRQGLAALLVELADGQAPLEASDTAEAIEQFAAQPFELILLDYHLRGENILESLGVLSAAFPLAQIVMLSGETDVAVIRRCISAGAAGFVLKSSSSEVLVAALQLVLLGGVYLPAHAVNDQSAGEQARPTSPMLEKLLTDRQMQVLVRAIRGTSNKVISRDLDIAVGTVKAHLSAAYRIMGVNNRTQAVFRAAEMGLLVDATGLPSGTSRQS